MPRKTNFYWPENLSITFWDIDVQTKQQFIRKHYLSLVQLLCSEHYLIQMLSMWKNDVQAEPTFAPLIPLLCRYPFSIQCEKTLHASQILSIVWDNWKRSEIIDR